MRKNLLLTCLFAGTALSSCIRADLSDCQGHEPEPEETRQLIYFRYTGDGTSDLLADKIKFADLYVFDENEQLVQSKGISAEELAATHGTTLQLPAGQMFYVLTEITYFKLRQNLFRLLLVLPSFFMVHTHQNFVQAGMPLRFHATFIFLD